MLVRCAYCKYTAREAMFIKLPITAVVPHSTLSEEVDLQAVEALPTQALGEKQPVPMASVYGCPECRGVFIVVP